MTELLPKELENKLWRMEKYRELLINLKDVSNNDSKEYLEDYIGSGLEYDIENNNSEFLFD